MGFPEKAIVAQLLADSAVSAVVADRISPLLSTQDDPCPRIVYTTEGNESTQTYASNGKEAGALQKASVTISCEALTFAEAADLAEKVRQAIDDGRGTWGGVAVDGCFYDDEDDDEDTDGETNVTVYTVEQRYSVWYRR